ncbi:cysteate synthase [Natronoflexus pectinivorans]|uniref:Cysteate synthase n=1 Tax=Natronoflexus pectinivorans TaxID=682526 RepID=A0A4R2GID1_9BACT|nr:cysteate synthase [Natronoflexus pectinivorans]TCO07044.1 cysteate synthase [Natronoflexus pectinivorans]
MTSDFKPTHYLLQSIKTGQQFSDQGWTLDAPNEKEPTLIRTVYEEVQLIVKDASMGIFRFDDWLPVGRYLQGSSAPATYKSEGMAKHLGLENLYVTFSGYWPEKGVTMRTCSFKETEAYTVCGRMGENQKGVLVVASAGNTARAFARVCSDNNVPLLLCVPEDNLDALWFDEPINDNVRLVCTRSGSDYFDAIHLSNKICSLPDFYAEGGARNVARRDGMGTTVLSAVTHIGRIPDLYFQAVGSGTGAVAAWEAVDRFIVDGRFGRNKMKLMVSQNAPFLAIYHAWKADSRDMLPLKDDDARKQVEEIKAKVLSNRWPAYPIAGGLYDCMKDAGGDVISVTNEELDEAAALFEKLEGNDVHPAAAVATASLIKSVNEGAIEKDAVVMLNITGGGEKRFKSEHEVSYLKPNHVFDIQVTMAEIEEVLSGLFQNAVKSKAQL